MRLNRWTVCCVSVLLVLGSLSIYGHAVTDATPVSTPKKTKKHTPVVVATPIPTEVVTSSPTPIVPEPPRLSFGVGYPDVRLRARIWGGLDGEFKFAFDNAAQAYSGRLYYTFWKWWVFDFNVGGEVGYINFSGIDTLTGSGMFYEPFAGVRYNINKLISLTTEIGPAFMNISSGGVNFASTDMIVTTAIYFHLF